MFSPPATHPVSHAPTFPLLSPQLAPPAAPQHEGLFTTIYEAANCGSASATRRLLEGRADVNRTFNVRDRAGEGRPRRCGRTRGCRCNAAFVGLTLRGPY